MAVKALAQWCTSWSPKLMPMVQTPGVQPRGITYLLADGVLGVRTLRRGLVEAAEVGAFFGGFCPWNHEPPTMRIAAALLRLRRLFFCVGDKWWRMMALSKAHTKTACERQQPPELSQWDCRRWPLLIAQVQVKTTYILQNQIWKIFQVILKMYRKTPVLLWYIHKLLRSVKAFFLHNK